MSASLVVGVKRGPCEDKLQSPLVCKRSRGLGTNDTDLGCRSPSEGELASKSIKSEFKVLLALFSGMNKEKIREVYDSTDQDVQAAIRILNQLTLQENGQQVEQQEKEQDHEDNEDGRSACGQIAEQLVDSGMQQLSTATNFQDGKQKLSCLLHHLEMLKEQQFQKVGEKLRENLRAYKHQNNILKRAVWIQNSRMQEIGQRENILRSQLNESQQKVRELEVKNYSLAMHLESAIKNQNSNGYNPPDVF